MDGRFPQKQPPAAGTPWSVRAARGPDGRPALEILEGGAVLDVMVGTPVAPEVLRGARRAGRGSQARAIAWGRRADDGAAGITVAFSRGRLRRRARAATVTWLTTWCWIAVAHGRFRRVVVTHRGTRSRLTLRRARL